MRGTIATHREARSVGIPNEPRETADGWTVDSEIGRYEDGDRKDLAESMIEDRSVPSSWLRLANFCRESG